MGERKRESELEPVLPKLQNLMAQQNPQPTIIHKHQKVKSKVILKILGFFLKAELNKNTKIASEFRNPTSFPPISAAQKTQKQNCNSNTKKSKQNIPKNTQHPQRIFKFIPKPTLVLSPQMTLPKRKFSAGRKLLYPIPHRTAEK